MKWYHIFLAPVILTIGLSLLVVPGYLLQAFSVHILTISNSPTLETICNMLGMMLGCGLIVYLLVKWYKRYGDRVNWF